MALAARGPDGRTWKIKRHWLSLRPRWRGREILDVPDVGDPFDLMDEGPFAMILAIVLLFVVALIVFPVFAILIEIAIAVVALTVTLGAKVLFRRPWIVEARTAGPPGETMRWKVVGWRRSHEVMVEIRAALEGGRPVLTPHAEEIVEPPSTSEMKRAAPEGGS